MKTHFATIPLGLITVHVKLVLKEMGQFAQISQLALNC